MGRFERVRAIKWRVSRRFLTVSTIAVLVATSVQSSILTTPQSAQIAANAASPAPVNTANTVTSVPGVDVVQPGGGTTQGTETVTLSTAGGALGGYASGNTTRRVDPPAASFPSTPTEVASLRDAHRRVIANPDGTLSLTTSSARLNFKDASGAWKPVDTALTATSANAGYDLAETANNGAILFNTKSASDPVAALQGYGMGLTFRVPALTGQGKQSGTHGVVFAGSGSDSSLTLSSTSEGFEFAAVLARSSAPNAYSFAVGSTGVSLRVAADRQTIEVLSGTGATAVVVGLISAPALSDARGAVAPAGSVTVSLDPSAAGLRAGETMLTYTIDRAWLASSGRAYPVTLDPTACIAWDATSNCTINTSGSANGYVDTFINDALPNQVGTGSVDWIGVDPTRGTTRSLYYFPHAALPDGAQVVSATLGLYLAGGTPSGQSVRTSAINSTWSGHGATWNNQPTTDSSTAVQTPIGNLSNGWLNIDVTSIERARYTRNGTDWRPDYGLELQTVDETKPCAAGGCGALTFNAGSMGSNEPTLTITYVVPHVKINFDPALGPDYAPTKMPANTTTTVPVQLNNNGSGYTYNACGGSTADCYKVGYRWFDARGYNVNISGFTASGLAELASAVANQTWGPVVNLPVAAPPIPGQYSLRLDLVHILNGQSVWASDWAYPSLYFARAKDAPSSANVHLTGQSVISRNDFTVAVSSGAMAGGDPKSVSLPDGSSASIDLSSGNLTVSGSSGLGFNDLGGSVGLSYYYDSAQSGDTTACDLVLGACGWGTNFDERIENASSGANYTYRDPAGNRYFVSPNANGQLLSDAPVKIDRPRVTVLDENVLGPWTTTGTGLPAVTTATAANGTHSYSFASANTAGAMTTAINVNINQYPLLGFSVKAATGGAGVGFNIRDNTTGATKWLVYTFGTDFTLPDSSMVKVALGGVTSDWRVAGGDAVPGGSAFPNELYIWSRVVGDSRFGGANDDYSVVGLGLFGNGIAGTDYIDALRFEPRPTTLFDEPAVSMPAWTSGASNAVATTSDKQVGASALKVLPADAASEPKILGLATSLSSTPYATWYWRKVGGSSIAETFFFHDANKPSSTGSVTYYAGPSVPAGVDPKYAIQVSPTAPNAWTRVTRDIEDDARQLVGFYNQGADGSTSTAGASPTADPVILDGYSLLAVDGSYAGFDWESLTTQPSLDITTGAVSGDDFVVTLPGGVTHRFNQDGLLTSIRDLDDNATSLQWTYDFASAGGFRAYKLGAVHAPSEGKTTSGGAAVRQIQVAYGTGTVTFTEKLGTAAAYSGRTAEFDVDASENLVTVIPARHTGACASAGSASGCIKYAYDANHFLTRAYDPRYDGSNLDYTDFGYVYGTGSTPTRAVSITLKESGKPLLRVLNNNTTPTGLYQRPEWQDADAVVANYAYYSDLTAGGGVYTEFRAIPCTAADCAGGTTNPAVPLDMLVSYRTDGLGNPTQETRYRLPGNAGPVISRRGTLAVAKIDNYPDPLAATQTSWTQSADQYVASVGSGNGDFYRTSVTHNDLGLQTSSTAPIANPAFGPASDLSKQAVAHTTEQLYDSKGHLIQSDDNTFLSNTGFENALAGWTVSGGTIDTAVARSGVASLSLSGAATASQRAQMVPGQTFRLQAGLKGDGGTPAVALRYERTDSTWVSLPLQVPTVGSGWTLMANDVTIPLDGTGQIELTFSIAGGSGAAHVDDVAVMTSFAGSAYNSLGQQVTTTDITGRVTQIGYAPDTSALPAGMPAPGATPAIFATTTTANYIDGTFDPAHPDQDVTSRATYDVWGRAVRKTDADGVGAWQLFAPNQTDVVTSTDGLGNATTTTYDEVGNKLTVTPPNGASERTAMTYTYLNNPLQATTPDGIKTRYVYNAAGRVTIKYANYVSGTPAAGTLTDIATTYSYDQYGHVTQTVGDQGVANASTESTYDLFGNVVTTTAHASSGDAGRTTTTQFDAAGRAAGVQSAIAPTATPAPLCPTAQLDVWEQMSGFGLPVIINITTPGQNGSVTFSGTAGQRVSILPLGPGNEFFHETILNPDGSALVASTSQMGSYHTFSDALNLTQTGTYTVRIDPDGTNTGPWTVIVYDLPADPVVASPGFGTPATLNLSTPGQTGSVTFSGTIGQRIGILPLGPGNEWFSQTVLNPDGSTLAGPWDLMGSYQTFGNVLTLPQTGTHTLRIDPDFENTGPWTVIIYSVPNDPVVASSGFGVPSYLNLNTPGQNGSVTFSGTTGQQISVAALAPGNEWFYQTILSPDGTTFAGPSHYMGSANGYTGPLTLTQTGTYTIREDPEFANTGTWTVTISNLGGAFTGPGAAAVAAASVQSDAGRLAAVNQPSHISRQSETQLYAPLPPTKPAPVALADPTPCYCNAVKHFDLNGNPVSSTDARAITSVVWLDLNGHPVRTIANYVSGASATADRNVSSTVQYDALGRTVSATDAIGRVTSTTFDGLNRVTKVTRADGSWTRTDFTAAGRTLQASTPGASGQGDSDVAWTRNVYDAAGRQTLTLRNYDVSGAAQYQYDGFETGSTTCSGAADGGFVLNSSTADTTADSVVAGSGVARLRVTAGGGASSGVACALAGSFVAGQTYHFKVNVLAASGTALTAVLGKDVASSTNKATAAVTATGSWQAVDVAWTPSAGPNTSASVAVVTSAAAGTKFYLDDVSVWNTATPAMNIPTTSVYNADGKIVRSLGAPGHAGDPQPLTATTYDSMGRVSTVTAAAAAAKPADAADGNLTSTYTYNALGQKTDSIDPKGITAHVDYDRMGNVVASTANYVSGGASDNTQNLRSTFAYDLLGELLGTCSPAAMAAGCNPATGTDTLAWHYVYDAMGHAIAKTPPSFQPADSLLTAVASTGSVYDVSGLLASTCSYVSGGCASALRHTDATYDALGRQTVTRLYAGSDLAALKMTSTSTYDAAGQVLATGFDGTGSGEGTGTVNYAYDPLGNKTSVSGSTAASTAIYNPDGTVQTRTDASGTSNFTYNKVGQLLTSTSAVYTGTLTYGWRLDGLMDTRGWPSGLAAAFAYDGANRPISETVGSIAAFVRGYDRDGNVLSDTQNLTGINGVAGAGVQTYTYDNAGRVLTDTMTSGAQQMWTKSYTYDADSNRITATDAGVQTAYEYNGLDQIVSSTVAGLRTTFAYDAYGNQTQSFINPNTVIPPLPIRTTYYAESSSIMTRTGSSQSALAAARDGNVDMYTSGSVSFSLSGPGTLTIHQFAGGTASLIIDGQAAGSLSGGCTADHPQTFSVTGAGNHTVLINSIVQHTCSAGNGWGFDGIEWSAPGPFTQADYAPTNLVATAAAYNQVNLTWTAPVNGSALVRYAISRNGQPLTTVDKAATAMTDWTAQPATLYNYTITAIDAQGNASSVATAAPITTPGYTGSADTTAPTAPTGATATANGGTEIDLSWTASTDNVAVAVYRIYRDSAAIDTTVSTTYADTTVSAGSTHTYYVVAVDGAGNTSGNSNAPQAATPAIDTTAPTVPQSVTASATAANRVTVSWSASTDAVGVTSYTISRGGTVISKVAGNSTSFTDYTTAPSTAYTYTVKASDAAGNTSAASSGASATTPASAPPADTTAPSAPSSLTATARNRTATDLSWTAATDNIAVAGYRVYRGSTLIATTQSTTYADTPLTAGTAYSYYVVAIDGAGNTSSQSNTASATTPANDTTAPTAPTGVTAASTASNVATVSWTASTDAVGVASYTIKRGGTAIGKVSGATTSYVDATTVPSTAYSYTVTASDASGNTSAASTAGTVTTPACTNCTTTTLNPVADSYVNQASSATNYGTATTFEIKGTSGSLENGYLRFDTTSVPAGTISRATLNLYSTTASTAGYAVKAESNTTWGESTITYANAPAMGATITTVPSTSANAYSSANVTSAVTTRGLISLGVTDPSTTINITFQSKEGTNKPQLLVATLPVDTTAPGTPTNLAGTVKSGSEVDLTWTASTDNIAVAGYRVYRDGTLIATVGSTSWFDTGLATGSAHTYTVSAIDAAGNASAQTAGLARTTLGGAADTTAPTAPATVTATLTSPISVTVSWAASTDAVGVSSYNISRGGTAISKVSGTTTSFVDTTALPGTPYVYSVSASDAAGNTGTATNATSVTTAACTNCTTTTLNPVADSYVNQASSGTNYGSATTFVINGSTTTGENGYLRFDTTSVPAGTIAGATLKLYSTSASTTTGYAVKAESNTTWGESTITWANAPALGSTITTVGATTINTYSSANVTSGVTTRGLISFGITDPSTTVPITFESKEGTNKPQLLVSTLPSDTTAPGTPTNLAGTVKSGSEVDLTWTASTDNVAVAGYRVYRDGTLIATVGSTSWFDTGLAAGSAHTYTVSAIDAAGNASAQTAGLARTTLNIAAPDTAAPTVPSNVQATAATSSSATVTWTASTDNVAVARYTVRRGGTVIGQVPGGATTFTDYTTAPSATYAYTITASDAAGRTSAASSAGSVTTPLYTPPADTTAPTIPAGLTATTASGTRIDLAWTASTDAVGVAGYRVYRNSTLVATTASTTFIDAPIARGSANTYYVTAFDGANNVSGASNTVSASTPPVDTTAPSVPSGLTVTSTVAGRASVAWTASSDNVGVTSYTITRNGAFLTKVAGTATSFVDYSAPAGMTATYTVAASDAAGNTSTPTTGVSVTVAAATPPPDTVKPTAPSALTATAGAGEIDLAWTASSDNNAVAGYNVRRDGTPIGVTYSGTFADIGLAPGTAHTYTITAFDGSGNVSDASGPATATANAAPPPSVAYSYDPADRLTAITSASGTATVFTIDALGRHGGQTVGTDGTPSTYAYLGTSNIVVAITAGSVQTKSAIDAVGNRVATGSAGAYGFLLGDLHGNTAGAINAACTAITDAFAYDAYGNTVASVTSGLPTPWRFQGRILESAGNSPDLYDFGARSYSPTIGAFTSLDSMQGSAQNTALLNGYLYANGNPATLIDPDGHLARTMYDEGPVHRGTLTSATIDSQDEWQRTHHAGTYAPPTRAQITAEANSTAANTKLEALNTDVNPSVTDRYRGGIAAPCQGPIDCLGSGFVNAPGDLIRSTQGKIGGLVDCVQNLTYECFTNQAIQASPMGLALDAASSVGSVTTMAVNGDWDGLAYTGGGMAFWTLVTGGLSKGAGAADGASTVTAEVPAYARSVFGRVTSSVGKDAIAKAETCPYCGVAPSTTVDHILANVQRWRQGAYNLDFDLRTSLANDLNNLIGACKSCNSSKSGKILGEGPGEWWPLNWPSGNWWPFGGP